MHLAHKHQLHCHIKRITQRKRQTTTTKPWHHRNMQNQESERQTNHIPVRIQSISQRRRTGSKRNSSLRQGRTERKRDKTWCRTTYTKRPNYSSASTRTHTHRGLRTCGMCRRTIEWRLLCRPRGYDQQIQGRIPCAQNHSHGRHERSHIRIL